MSVGNDNCKATLPAHISLFWCRFDGIIRPHALGLGTLYFEGEKEEKKKGGVGPVNDGSLQLQRL